MKTFEERLKRLEELSDLVRTPETGLEKAAAYFEEGVRLARGLEKDLSKVERTIEILVSDKGEDGEKPVLELFPELDSDEAE
jgi:exodeoxyribonuclease VII small subunit